MRNIDVGRLKKETLVDILRSYSQGNTEENLVILFYNQEINSDIKKNEKDWGITIFSSDNCDTLIMEYSRFVKKIKARKKAELVPIFPVLLKIVDLIVSQENSLYIKVKIQEGVLRIGTPLCLFDKFNYFIGYIKSIELLDTYVNNFRKKDEAVILKIQNALSPTIKVDIDEHSEIISLISRKSLYAIETYCRNKVMSEDIELLNKLRFYFNIT